MIGRHQEVTYRKTDDHQGNKVSLWFSFFLGYLFCRAFWDLTFLYVQLYFYRFQQIQMHFKYCQKLVFAIPKLSNPHLITLHSSILWPFNTYPFEYFSVSVAHPNRVSPVDHHNSCWFRLSMLCCLQPQILYRGEWSFIDGSCCIFVANGFGNLHQGLVLSMSLMQCGCLQSADFKPVYLLCLWDI